jgi:hypothetical protein
LTTHPANAVYRHAKYDMVRPFNEVFDALGLGESIVQRVLARAIALPAARFFRMKRSVSLLVSHKQSAGRGNILDGAWLGSGSASVSKGGDASATFEVKAGTVRHMDRGSPEIIEMAKGSARAMFFQLK